MMRLEKMFVTFALPLALIACRKNQEKPKYTPRKIAISTPIPTPVPYPELAKIGKMAPDPYKLNEEVSKVLSTNENGYLLISPQARGGIVNLTREGAALIKNPYSFVEIVLDSNNDGKLESYFSNRLFAQEKIHSLEDYQVRFLEFLGLQQGGEDNTKRRLILMGQDITIRMVTLRREGDKTTKIIHENVVEYSPNSNR